MHGSDYRYSILTTIRTWQIADVQLEIGRCALQLKQHVAESIVEVDDALRAYKLMMVPHHESVSPLARPATCLYSDFVRSTNAQRYFANCALYWRINNHQTNTHKTKLNLCQHRLNRKTTK